MEHPNRARILQAARQLFNARGYRNVTVQDLAEQLGMSKKTIYQFFSGKEDIATAVVEETMSLVLHVLDETDRANPEPLQAIREILINVKDDATRFGPLFLMDIEKYLPELASRFHQFRQEKNRRVEQWLLDAQRDGYLRDVPIPMAVDVLKICLKAIVHAELQSPNRFSLEDKLGLFLDIFCNGIAQSRQSIAKG